MNREQYYLEKEVKSKDLIIKTIDIFFKYDGNLTEIGKVLNKSKATVSRILNSELFDKMVDNNEIDKKISIVSRFRLIFYHECIRMMK